MTGPRDYVHLFRSSGSSWEAAIFQGNANYNVARGSVESFGKKCDGQFDNVTMGGLLFCKDGIARFDPEAKPQAQNPNPDLRGYYKQHTNHEEILRRGRQEIMTANQKYQRLLAVAINRLAKEGKMKVEQSLGQFV